jgi:hypothetical protein
MGYLRLQRRSDKGSDTHTVSWDLHIPKRALEPARSPGSSLQAVLGAPDLLILQKISTIISLLKGHSSFAYAVS